MNFQLKHYQQASLDWLQRYLEAARNFGAKAAFDRIQTERYQGNPYKPYRPLDGLVETPYVCLRLPTGGGKTLLSANTIRLAGESYLEREKPLTLWLVPTKIIKEQTLETLKNPEHPNRKALDTAFGVGNVRVFDVSDFTLIRPYDLENSACVIVSTFAALRVEDTEGRKVYAHNEDLEPCFSMIPPQTPNMERGEDGKLKFSFANLLHFHRPLVVVDEAHNAKTGLSMDVLKRVNAACVVEYTATPAEDSNVIVSISAAELKAEEMIKLPIVLNESISWEDAIVSALQTRHKLQELADRDKDYIRPIILFQAENKDKEITVDKIKSYLIDNENIPPEQIAVATGEQKDLDGIDLFDPNCPIRYVITVQALKEGWDCSFAYVLCSVANTKSKTAVEQLLGRVLRMPYAKARTQEELNRGYAHVSSQSWPQATSQLYDRLVSMGFEKQEADDFVIPQPAFFNLDDKQNLPLEVTVNEEPDLSALSTEEASYVRIEKTPFGITTVILQASTPESVLNKVKKGLSSKKDKDEFSLKAKLFDKQKKALQSPAQRGEVFSLPQLCLFDSDGEITLADKETCLGDEGWNLLDYPTVLDHNVFRVSDNGKQYIADLKDEKVVIHALEAEQLSMEGVYTDMDEQALCLWLARRLRHPDTVHPTLLEFLRRTVQNLLARSDLDMAKLNRGKFILEKVLRGRIEDYRKDAYKKGVQGALFGDSSRTTVDKERFSFNFDPYNYPANPLYDGAFRFEKHYYDRIGSMNSEEVECAQAIDRNPLIKFWVRNIERQPNHAFWLPTSSDNFYPDFVCQLKDGRQLVIEYKGAHLKNDDTKEKELVGLQWAKASDNLFLMAWKQDSDGRDVYQQINSTL